MIMLKNDYFIDADDRNFVLCKKSISEKGNVRYDPLSYHMDLDQALESYYTRMLASKVGKKEIITLAEAMKEARLLREDILNMRNASVND